MRRKLIDLTGQKFNSWTVLKKASNNKWRQAMWHCRCDCGRESIVPGGNLRSGESKGCRSCFIKNILIKHGQWGARLYYVWWGMIQRCENLNSKDYKNWGGRGILVCPEWRKDFSVFRKWALGHGYKDNLTIDRISNDKGYSPENCQFITKSENSLKSWHVDGSHGDKYLKAS